MFPFVVNCEDDERSGGTSIIISSNSVKVFPLKFLSSSTQDKAQIKVISLVSEPLLMIRVKVEVDFQLSSKSSPHAITPLVLQLLCKGTWRWILALTRMLLALVTIFSMSPSFSLSLSLFIHFRGFWICDQVDSGVNPSFPAGGGSYYRLNFLQFIPINNLNSRTQSTSDLMIIANHEPDDIRWSASDSDCRFFLDLHYVQYVWIETKVPLLVICCLFLSSFVFHIEIVKISWITYTLMSWRS